MLALFLIALLGFSDAFENDCFDKCTCQNTAIWCNGIFEQPKLIVSAPEQVESLYISYSDIRNMTFINQFVNLKILSLFEVSIECSLLQEGKSTWKFKVEAPSCHGIYAFYSFIIFCETQLVFCNQFRVLV